MRRVHAVASSANSVTQLHLLVRELCNRFDLNKGSIQCLRHPRLKEFRLEQSLRVMLVEQLEHSWEEIWHSVVVLEGWRPVAFPYLIPNILGISAAGADKPLGIIVQRNLRQSAAFEGRISGDHSHINSIASSILRAPH